MAVGRNVYSRAHLSPLQEARHATPYQGNPPSEAAISLSHSYISDSYIFMDGNTDVVQKRSFLVAV